MQLGLNSCLAIAAIGGHGPGTPAGTADSPCDGRDELWGVGGVAALNSVVNHDAVDVVHDLGFVAELDRAPEAAFGDRAGVSVMQADPPGRAVRSDTGQALAGLGGDAARRAQELDQVVDCPA